MHQCFHVVRLLYEMVVMSTAGWSLQVRGPIVLERYHKADGLCVDTDNWFDTGDVASIDRFGVMKIQDRWAAVAAYPSNLVWLLKGCQFQFDHGGSNSAGGGGEPTFGAG
jgi:acyl-CoA synthetase (AMP-forming)/AMP-acid ligase II